MITYAAIKNNTVVNVLVFDDDVTTSTIQSFKETLELDDLVIATDKMVVGSIKEGDIWVLPSPWPSWVLDYEYNWNAPIPMPAEQGPWRWDEPTVSWKRVI